MSARPFMPLWIGDFVADTQHLNCAESGSYILLLMHLWLTGELADDDRRLARIARATPRQWRSMRPVLEPFFDIGAVGDCTNTTVGSAVGGCPNATVGSVAVWRHKRVEAELAKACAYSEKQRGNANERWRKTDTDGNATAYARARATSQPHPQTGGRDAGENRSLVAAGRRAQEAADRQLAEHLARANDVDHEPGQPTLRVVSQG